MISWADHLVWLIEIVVILALVIVVNICIRIAFRKLAHRLHTHRKEEKLPTMEGFITALSLPLRLLIWVVGLALITDIILNQWTLWEIPSPTSKIVRLAIVLALTWFILRWKNEVYKAMRGRVRQGQSGLERHQLEAIGKLITLLVLIIAIVMILQVFGLNLQALVAIGGFGTLAVGFAGKDVFANFFSGIMIYFTRPFSVGDRIQVPEKGIEGFVENIGWYLTAIRGFDKRPIYVPNSIFSTVQVINGSRMTNRRIRFHLSIRYNDLPQANGIAAAIADMLAEHPDLDQTYPGTARLTEYGDYSLEVLVQGFTKTTNWGEFLSVQQNVLLKCADIVRRHGADFAYPTTTVNLSKQP